MTRETTNGNLEISARQRLLHACVYINYVSALYETPRNLKTNKKK
jgi:hypothetical protein